MKRRHMIFQTLWVVVLPVGAALASDAIGSATEPLVVSRALVAQRQGSTLVRICHDVYGSYDDTVTALAAIVRASERVLGGNGERRGGVPELWDGRASERIADVIAAHRRR